MKLSFNNREPVYLQVVNYFKVQIATGQLRAGEEIPSRRELAQAFQINPNTVQKAYKEMEAQQLIQTVRNFPSTVTKEEEILMNVKNELIQDAVTQFITAVEKIQLPVEELVGIVRQQYEATLKKEDQQ